MNIRKTVFFLKVLNKTIQWGAQLKKNETLNSNDLSNLSFLKLKKLVRHCQLNVPYYRKLFNELGVDWTQLEKPSDLAHFPILEKEHVRSFQSELIATGYCKHKLRSNTTGGTTGEPLTVFSDPKGPSSVATWRMLNQWGVDVSDNSGYLYRAVPRGLRNFFSRLYLYPTKRVYLGSAEMNRKTMERFYYQLRNIRPKYLVGYVGALDAFADFLKETGRNIPSLQVIWTTAAPLPDLKRKYLSEVYNCPVYTQYGSVETFMIAAESPERNGLYIYNDIRHVEVVNCERPAVEGELGDVLVTDLTNYAFPLLRYRLGDQSRLLPYDPSAKLPFPRMDYVRGRITDNIKLPDGTSIAGEFWTTIFDDFPSYIKSFQILQKKDYSLEISYEPHSINSQEAIKVVRRNLELKMKKSVPLHFIERKINNNENGKTRFVKSELVK